MKRHKGIKKLAPQKYLVRIRAADPRTGKPKDIKRISSGPLEAALALQTHLAEQLAQGGPRARVTLTDYSRSWLKRRIPTLKPSTRRKYASDLTHHILPAFGDYYIDTLRPRDIAEFIATQSKTYSGATVLNRLRLLRTIAKDAQADDLTDRDFCARVKPPTCNQYTEENPNLLTPEQLNKLAQAIPPQWYPLFATLAFTGLRFGEASALTWSDFDHVGGQIFIRRSNYKGQTVQPKTCSSRRTVPMVPELGAILRKHRADMVATQHSGLSNGWVFPTQNGNLHKGAPLGPVIKHALARAGLDLTLTTHGLRRTFNNLARRVATGQVVRAIVGHSTQAMTEKYSVIALSEKQAVQASVLRLISKPTP